MQFHKEVGQHRKHFYMINFLQDTEKLLEIRSSFFCLFLSGSWTQVEHSPWKMGQRGELNL